MALDAVAAGTTERPERTLDVGMSARQPVGRSSTELLGVLRVQPLPAAELHGLGADDASNRSNPASPATRRRATPTSSLTWPRSCRPCGREQRDRCPDD